MSESIALVPPGKPLLDDLPVRPFDSVMGLTGLSVAWRFASARYGVPKSYRSDRLLLRTVPFAALPPCGRSCVHHGLAKIFPLAVSLVVAVRVRLEETLDIGHTPSVTNSNLVPSAIGKADR